MSKKKAIHHQRPVAFRVWFATLALLGVFGIVLALVQGTAIGVLSSIILLIMVAGLWNWQRWAYFGTIGAGVLVLVLALIGLSTGVQSNLVSVGMALAILIITVALVQPRLSWFH